MAGKDLYSNKRRKESWKDVDLDSLDDLPKAVEQKAEKEPVTIGEVHEVTKEKGVKTSRSTVKTTMNAMAEDGKLKAKKPKEKSSKIFWKNGD